MDRPIRNCGVSTRLAEARRRRQMRTTGNPCIPPAKDSQFSMRRTAYRLWLLISDAEKAKEVPNLQRAPKPKPPFPEQRMPRTPPPCAHRHWQTCGQPLFARIMESRIAKGPGVPGCFRAEVMFFFTLAIGPAELVVSRCITLCSLPKRRPERKSSSVRSWILGFNSVSSRASMPLTKAKKANATKLQVPQPPLCGSHQPTAECSITPGDDGLHHPDGLANTVAP